MGLTRVLGGILFLALLYNPVQALSATLPDPYSLTLTGDPSPSIEFISYSLYYGTASGSYTNSIVMGNVTTVIVPGLSSGVTCFFAIIAVDANGQESDFSNEVSYARGLPSVQIHAMTGGAVHSHSDRADGPHV
jgi:hypothetical protein